MNPPDVYDCSGLILDMMDRNVYSAESVRKLINEQVEKFYDEPLDPKPYVPSDEEIQRKSELIRNTFTGGE